MKKLKDHPMQEHGSTWVVIIFVLIFLLIALLFGNCASAQSLSPQEIKYTHPVVEKPNMLFVSIQPIDMGLGVRYDRRFGSLGGYAGLAKGHYKLEDGSYINDHYKFSLGGVAYIPDNFGFVSVGVCYHRYGESYFPEPMQSTVMTPVSCEMGFGTWLGRMAITLRMDVIKWESALEFGIRF